MKKVLSFLLVLVMAAALFPAFAYADDPVEFTLSAKDDQIDGYAVGDTVSISLVAPDIPIVASEGFITYDTRYLAFDSATFPTTISDYNKDSTSIKFGKYTVTMLGPQTVGTIITLNLKVTALPNSTGGYTTISTKGLKYSSVFGGSSLDAAAEDLELALGFRIGHTHVTDDGHHHNGNAATCTTTGTIEYWSCVSCGLMFSDAELTTEIDSTDIDMLPHKMSHFAAVDPTETKDGNIEYWKCSTCGQYFTTETGYDDDGESTDITEEDTIRVKTGSDDLEKPIIPGDVDDDGDVTSIDLTFMKRYFAYPGVEAYKLANMKNGDIDGDGSVTSIDLTLFKRYFAYPGQFTLGGG